MGRYENEYIFCPKCGKKTSKDSVYCSKCGKRIDDIYYEQNNMNSMDDYENDYYDNQKIRSFASSPMFLAFTILSIISAILCLISGNIINFISFILISIGAWKFYNSSKFNNGRIEEGVKKIKSGVKLNYVFWLIGIICSIVVVLLLLVTGDIIFEYITEMDLTSEELQIIMSFKPIWKNIAILLILVVVIVLVIGILFYKSLFKYFDGVIDLLTKGKKYKNSFRFFPVIFIFIVYGLSLFSQFASLVSTNTINEILSSLISEFNVDFTYMPLTINVISVLTQICVSFTYLCGGCLLLKCKNEIF